MSRAAVAHACVLVHGWGCRARLTLLGLLVGLLLGGVLAWSSSRRQPVEPSTPPAEQHAAAAAAGEPVSNWAAAQRRHASTPHVSAWEPLAAPAPAPPSNGILGGGCRPW